MTRIEMIIALITTYSPVGDGFYDRREDEERYECELERMTDEELEEHYNKTFNG